MKNAINTERPLMNTEGDDLYKFISIHGLARALERTDKNRAQAIRMIRNARTRGKREEELETSEQRRFAHSTIRQTDEGLTEARVYCGYIFIFSPLGRLITMFKMPRRVSRKKIYDGKVRVRNVRKYNRFNEEMEDAADDKSAA